MRRLREEAQLTRDDVEQATGINQATLYRLETAKVRPQRRTLTTLLRLYEVPASRREEILAYARESAQPTRPRIVEPELADDYATFIGFEAEANRIVNYESLLVPGLLQTADYAVAAISGLDHELPRHEVERRVNVRLRRQALLDGDRPLRLEVLIDEGVVRREIGSPRITVEQLRHLLTMARRPNISLRVIPFGAGAHPGLKGPFVLLTFPDPADPPIVYLESVTSAVFLEEDRDVANYRDRIERLATLSLDAEDSLRLVRGATAQYLG